MDRDLEDVLRMDGRFAMMTSRAQNLEVFFECEDLRRRAAQIFAEPALLPLCELALNGATAYEGAVYLRQEGYAERSSFTVRRGPLAGISIVAFDLTAAGRDAFADLLEMKQDIFDDGLMGHFQSYCVIDQGSGIVASRSLIEAALEIGDGALIERLADPAQPVHAGQGLSLPTRIDASQRAEALTKWVSQEGDDRSGAAILDLRDLLIGGDVRIC